MTDFSYQWQMNVEALSNMEQITIAYLINSLITYFVAITKNSLRRAIAHLINSLITYLIAITNNCLRRQV